jgi:hypothetical protein
MKGWTAALADTYSLPPGQVLVDARDRVNTLLLDFLTNLPAPTPATAGAR